MLIESLDNHETLSCFPDGAYGARRPPIINSRPRPAQWRGATTGTEAKPVLRIKSGDTVAIQTMTTSSPTSLANAGVKDEDIQPELKAIYAAGETRGSPRVRAATSSPGRSLSKAPSRAMCWRCGFRKSSSPRRTPPTVSARSGACCRRRIFEQGRTKIIPLDMKRNVAKFADNIEIPLHPFFGSMGVAPDESKGQV